MPKQLVKHVKVEVADQAFKEVPKGESFLQHAFVRAYAVDVTFDNVSFKQCNMTSCYFRKCTFVDCDFTGAIIKDSNFAKSQFNNCDFRYSSWEKTIVDPAILDTGLPSEFNLARDFVRSLRVNFTQIGNQDAVNKAAAIEVGLTGKHLWHAATSKESYYRSKYRGWDRLHVFVQFFWWQLLDLLWGNGESPWKVLFWAIATPTIFACFNYPGTTFMNNLHSSLCAFLGLPLPSQLSILFAAPLTVARYILFGLFVSLLVRKFSRR